MDNSEEKLRERLNKLPLANILVCPICKQTALDCYISFCNQSEEEKALTNKDKIPNINMK